MLIEKTITINRPIDLVYAYVLDFSQLYEWDDQVTEGYRIDLGPIKVGSKFSFLYSIAGSKQKIEYIIDEIEENNRLKLICNASNFSAIDTILFKKLSQEQTQVTYRAQINLGSKMKDFLMSNIMERVGNKLVKRLKEVLENKEVIYPTGNQLSLANLAYRFTTPGWNNRRKEFSATIACAKTVLITGPTSGLGKSVTFSLAGKGCDLILVARNKNKLDLLESELRQSGFQKSIRSYVCDLEDLELIQETCDKILSENKIDVVINNAGMLYSNAQLINGIERTTVVDLLAPWIFTSRLVPYLRPGGCIINVSSGGMYGCGLNIPELKIAKEPFSGSRAYALAKRGLEIFSVGLNEQVQTKNGIRIHCMHPGWADTPGVLNSLPSFRRVTKPWLRSSFQGADTIVWLAMNNPDQGGEFWLDRQIQPRYILKSTKSQSDDYSKLRIFLDSCVKTK